MAVHFWSSIGFLSLLLVSLFVYSHGLQFNVGGKHGWIPNPPQDYNEWAGRMRFQVNDTLFFKYKKGSDSVLVVDKDDYDSCNTEDPITEMEDGSSIFKFDRSGHFYFISGNKESCENHGQKLNTLVMAVRSPKISPSPPGNTPSPTTPISTPSPAPPADVQSPSPSGSGMLAFTPSVILVAVILGVAL